MGDQRSLAEIAEDSMGNARCCSRQDNLSSLFRKGILIDICFLFVYFRSAYVDISSPCYVQSASFVLCAFLYACVLFAF